VSFGGERREEMGCGRRGELGRGEEGAAAALC